VIKVLLVDDHPVVREGVGAILVADSDIDLVGSEGTLREARKVIARVGPHVVVADVHLPDGDGIEFCEALRRRHPDVRTLILTRFDQDRVMVRAFAAGARAFVLKECNPDILRFGVRIVAGGGIFIDPAIAGRVVSRLVKGERSQSPFGLTFQQGRVLELIVKGLTNREIATELGVGEETVKTHVSMLLPKIGAEDRTHAAVIAQQEGIV
jgi:DNA-binding NarL/FixJ family response regulator